MAVLRIQVVAFTVHCRACGWRGLVPTGLLEQTARAHHQPVLHAVHARFDGGPLQMQRLVRPKPLMR